ncbi:MAG: GatB/YqeY domain-containing protein [Dehalococcoidia bacterium]|nr:GatB/YqeY domain-containing protein [Dehalococcoidia bacterium]MCB9486210.1 GatB/YqeY domain-containing protein [Thermoflexaceae bacterium]
MSNLKEQLQSDLLNAMRARDETRKSSLRMLTAAIKNAEIEARAPLADADVLSVIQKQVKQRRESIIEFEKGGRQDLVDKERAEMTILETYLPPQAGRDQIEAAARRIIAETGASSVRDIGKVMPLLVKEFAGTADGRTINDVVRSLLGS